jgi:hypothetical protein
MLCRNEAKNISRLMIKCPCPYAQQIWKEAEQITRNTDVWNGDIVKECLMS